MKHLTIFLFGCLMVLNCFADVMQNEELNCCYEILKTNSSSEKDLNIIANQQTQYLNQFDSVIKLLELRNDSIIVSHSIKIPPDKKANNFVGALIGALISGLIALGIYKLGEQNDKKKLRNEKDELGEAINVLLESAHKTSVKQVKEYKAYIELIDSNPTIAHTMRKYPSHNLKRLRNFDSVDIYRIFKHLKLDKDLYNKFLNNIDFLDEIAVSINEDYDENNKEFITKLSNDFLKISQEILTDSANHLDELRLNGLDKSDKFNFINDLILAYYQIPDELDMPNIKYDYDNFIKPMKIEMITKYRFDSFSKQITSKTKRASDLYVSVIKANNHLRDSLNLQLENIDNATEKLNEIREKLSQYYAS